MSLPIAWVLKDKSILLVGGGEVAETRVRKILPEEANIVVVAPTVTPYIEKLSESCQLRWLKRKFQMSDLDLEHWSFVLTAINDRKTSKEIAHRCRSYHIPVNVADVIPLCDFFFGANFQQGPLKVMVSTGSGAPRLAKRVLNELSQHASKFRYAEAITKVSMLRRFLRDQLPGDDPKVSQTRMLLMKTMCDKLSFQELAALSENDMRPLIRGMLLSTAACPAQPIGEVENASDFVDDYDVVAERKNKKMKLDSNNEVGSHRKHTDDSSSERSSSDSSSENGSSASDRDDNDDSDGSDGSGTSSSDEDRQSSTNSSHNSLTNKTSSDALSDKSKKQAENGTDASGVSYFESMKLTAVECAEGYPTPKVPSFPFKKKKN